MCVSTQRLNLPAHTHTRATQGSRYSSQRTRERERGRQWRGQVQCNACMRPSCVCVVCSCACGVLEVCMVDVCVYAEESLVDGGADLLELLRIRRVELDGKHCLIVQLTLHLHTHTHTDTHTHTRGATTRLSGSAHSPPLWCAAVRRQCITSHRVTSYRLAPHRIALHRIASHRRVVCWRVWYPAHEVVDVFGCRALDRLGGLLVGPQVAALACRHHRARRTRAILADGAVQHRDLVEEISGCTRRAGSTGARETTVGTCVCCCLPACLCACLSAVVCVLLTASHSLTSSPLGSFTACSMLPLPNVASVC